MSRSDDDETGGGADRLRALGAALAVRPYARRGVPVRSEPVRVVLVDDHEIFRAGVKSLLSTAPDIIVVGEAAGGREALELAERLAPDVVVMDLDMPGGDGLAATEALRALERPPRVLILSMHLEEERLVPLLEAGAVGYLAKDAAERDLVEAIRVVAGGEVYVRPHVARLLASAVRRAGAPDPARASFDALSDREQMVVRLTAEGYSGAEIGRELGISRKTVDTYKQRVEEKLGVAHRTEYVRLALALGLIRK